MALTPYRIAERALGLVSGHFPGEEAFIWNSFLPTVNNLPATSGLYAVEDQANYFGNPDFKAGIGDLEPHPEVIVGDLTSGTYQTKIRGAKSLIARDWLTDAQDGISVMERHTNKVRRNVWIQQEVSLNNLLLDTTAAAALWPDAALAALGGPAAGVKWSTVATSDPIADLIATKDAIYQQSGVMPDSLLMSYDVAMWASVNPQVRGYVGSSAAGIASGGSLHLTFDDLAATLNRVLFGGAGKVEILSALRNTVNPALPIVAGTNIQPISTDTYWMGKLGDPQATVNGQTVTMDPVAAARLEFGGWMQATEELDEDRGVKVYGHLRDVQQLINANLGYLVTDVV